MAMTKQQAIETVNNLIAMGIEIPEELRQYVDEVPSIPAVDNAEKKILVCNDKPVDTITTKEYTLYTSAPKGKKSKKVNGKTVYLHDAEGKYIPTQPQQLCLFVAPEPCGFAKGKDEFNGNYVVVYPKGVGKSDDVIKGINERVCESFMTKKADPVFKFKLNFIGQEYVTTEDITQHPDFIKKVHSLAENLAKPKSFLVKVMTLKYTVKDEEKVVTTVFFVSKYTETSKSTTIVESKAGTFIKATKADETDDVPSEE